MSIRRIRFKPSVAQQIRAKSKDDGEGISGLLRNALIEYADGEAEAPVVKERNSENLAVFIDDNTANRAAERAKAENRTLAEALESIILR